MCIVEHISREILARDSHIRIEDEPNALEATLNKPASAPQASTPPVTGRHPRRAAPDGVERVLRLAARTMVTAACGGRRAPPFKVFRPGDSERGTLMQTLRLFQYLGGGLDDVPVMYQTGAPSKRAYIVGL
jgi:hypothetical protein